MPAAVALGTSADLKVGQSAFAIGNPFGLDQSLSSGIISALKRRLPTSSGREIANVIQTDAAINPATLTGILSTAHEPARCPRRPLFPADHESLPGPGLLAIWHLRDLLAQWLHSLAGCFRS
jgi:hypothetical protein